MTVQPPPDLLIDKDTSTPVVVAGGQAEFSVVVRNVGGVTVEDVEIYDPLPAGFTYASSTMSSSSAVRTAVIDPAAGDSVPTWGVWDIAPGGSVTINFTVDIASTVPAGVYDNTAYASSSNHATVDDDGTVAQDADTPPGEDPEDDEDVEVGTPPELLIDKDTSTPSVSAGGQAQYTIVVYNVGAVTATDVEVYDTLPAGFTHASSTMSASNAARTAVIDPAAGDAVLTWGTWDIDPGGSLTISLTVDIATTVPEGIYDNTAYASASNHPTVDDEGEVEQDADTPPGQDPECDEDVVVGLPGGPGVDVKMTLQEPAGGTATVGHPVRFQVEIENVGTTEIISLPLSDVFSDGCLGYVGSSPGANNVAGDLLVWYDLGPLAVGDSHFVTVEFSADSVCSQATNTACVNAAVDENGDAVPAACDDASLAIIAAPVPTPTPVPDYGPGDVEVTKRVVDPPGSRALVGDTIRWEIVIENIGGSNIATLPLSDLFTNLFLSFDSASPAPDNVVGNMIIWYDLGPLPMGSSKVVTVDLYAEAEHPNARNVACVTSATDVNQQAVRGDCGEDYVVIDCERDDPLQCSLSEWAVSGAKGSAHIVYLPMMR